MDDPISLRQIEAFLMVAELRSLAKAATQLRITPSALSRSISSIESVVGERLFHRQATGLALTAVGQSFLPYARKLHATYLATLNAGLTAPAPSVRLAVCDFLMPTLMAAIPAEASATGLNGTRVRWDGMPSHHVLQCVANGEVDAGVCMVGTVPSGLQAIPLLRAPLGLLLAQSMPLPAVVTTLESIAPVRMVRLADASVLAQMLRGLGKRSDAYFQAEAVVHNMPTLLTVVQEGHWATIASAITASTRAAQGLRYVPLPHLLPSVQLCWVAPAQDRRPIPMASVFRLLADAVLQARWMPGVESISGSGLQHV